MALPKKMLWPLEPHTKGKHDVLRAYLDAWLPIMAKWNGRILFIDGFAGPGEYEDGEEGSPQVALRALVDHSAKHAIKAEVGFGFIENNAARAQHLSDIVEPWKKKLPPKCWIDVENGPFDQTMAGLLDALDEQSDKLAPTFLMIDPFGVSGTPMDIVARVLRNPKCEVYVSLMYEPINRFCNSSEFSDHLDVLFGTPDWRNCAKIKERDERKDCFFNLYESQLRNAGATNVVNFDLFSGNRHIYSIFFATQHPLGCDRMKAAIWKAAPDGGFQIRGTHSNQLVLGMEGPDFSLLQAALQENFKEKGWVTIEQVTQFVQSDSVDFHSGQLKRNALVHLEKSGQLEVDQTTRKRRNTYPDRCRMRFL